MCSGVAIRLGVWTLGRFWLLLSSLRIVGNLPFWWQSVNRGSQSGSCICVELTHLSLYTIMLAGGIVTVFAVRAGAWRLVSVALFVVNSDCSGMEIWLWDCERV